MKLSMTSEGDSTIGVSLGAMTLSASQGSAEQQSKGVTKSE